MGFLKGLNDDAFRSKKSTTLRPNSMVISSLQAPIIFFLRRPLLTETKIVVQADKTRNYYELEGAGKWREDIKSRFIR